MNGSPEAARGGPHPNLPNRDVVESPLTLSLSIPFNGPEDLVLRKESSRVPAMFGYWAFG